MRIIKSLISDLWARLRARPRQDFRHVRRYLSNGTFASLPDATFELVAEHPLRGLRGTRTFPLIDSVHARAALMWCTAAEIADKSGDYDDVFPNKQERYKVRKAVWERFGIRPTYWEKETEIIVDEQ